MHWCVCENCISLNIWLATTLYCIQDLLGCTDPCKISLWISKQLSVHILYIHCDIHVYPYILSHDIQSLYPVIIHIDIWMDIHWYLYITKISNNIWACPKRNIQIDIRQDIHIYPFKISSRYPVILSTYIHRIIHMDILQVLKYQQNSWIS
jgi:hypothetical protein